MRSSLALLKARALGPAPSFLARCRSPPSPCILSLSSSSPSPSSSLGRSYHNTTAPASSRPLFSASYTVCTLPSSGSWLPFSLAPATHYSTSPCIYTRTGDSGASSLFTGERRPKDDPIFHALGHTDELNALIGVARAFIEDQQSIVHQHCEEIQSRLLDLGSSVATPSSSANVAQLERVHFDPKHVEVLENWIDALTEELPPLRNFILPSGGKASSSFHVARAVCRRAERSLLLCESPDPLRHYLNRLSDYLFTAARYVSMREGHPETPYKKVKERTRRS
eukprot:CAMPEP_0177663756 /NCGR_PEP_ID=MMETSP0447-20121125/20096_1 /TAXON_ID=0 /ORGANISM="Stygamoeba regulata, Strain BSH-02190019" /LENGTH=280 /DNA_ID=CAMNT_0019169615 /DNA_START=64 /DNA_END=906 /DNA_ORIENTATION=+